MAHTHTAWLSDFVDPIASLELDYRCTLQFVPEICNHWMVGDNDKGEMKLESAPGWWDFMFRVPFTGQFGISSRLSAWNAALRDRAAAKTRRASGAELGSTGLRVALEAEWRSSVIEIDEVLETP